MEQEKPKKRRGGARPGSGRKVGSLTKANSEMRFDLLQTLREKGFNPVAELIETHDMATRQYHKRLRNSTNGYGSAGLLEIRRECESDLMQYVFPKLKSMELTGKDGRDLFQSFADIMREVAKEESNGDKS